MSKADSLKLFQTKKKTLWSTWSVFSNTYIQALRMKPITALLSCREWLLLDRRQWLCSAGGLEVAGWKWCAHGSSVLGIGEYYLSVNVNIFWPILEPEIVSEPPHTCVQKSRPLSPKKKTTRRSSWGSNLGMKEATFLRSRTSGNDGSTTPSFFFLTCEKVVFVGLLTSVYGLCWRQRLVRLHTRVWRVWNGLWFENGPNTLETLPCRGGLIPKKTWYGYWC